MILGNLLFFLMLFAPRTYQFIKIPLVCLALLLIAADSTMRKYKPLDFKIVKWFYALLIFGALWSLLGMINGNPGTHDAFRLNFIWVCLYFVFVYFINEKSRFQGLIKTMVYAGIAIAIYNLTIIAQIFGYIPDMYSFLQIDEGTLVGVFEGYSQLTSNNIGTLTFLAPFLISLSILSDGNHYYGLNKRLLLVSATLSVVAVLISGRRALWLEILFTPLLLSLFIVFRPDLQSKQLVAKIFKVYLFAALLLILAGFLLNRFYHWEFGNFADRLVSAFGLDQERQDQLIALLKGFRESPFLGAGFGVGVDVIRNYERPWIYELSYVQMLYNTGIVGIALYFYCYFIIYYHGFRTIVQKPHEKTMMISLLVAFTCFIIANATNPYFGTYDFMWILFLPISFINLLLIEPVEGTEQNYS